MTLVEHLTELRTRLIRSAIAVAAGALVAWLVYQPILNALLEPLRASAPKGSSIRQTLVTLDPLEPFAIRLKLATYGGLMLAMPVILWQVWRFVEPGLYSNEKRYAVGFTACATLLFAMGAAIAFWTMPKALDWLRTIGGPNFTQLYGPAKYIKLIVYMMLAFGVGFEFPILVVFLQLAGIVSTARLRSARRYVYVAIAVVVAVITPSGDPISMLALTIPMWIFYEAAVVFGRLRERRRRKAEAAAAAAAAA